MISCQPTAALVAFCLSCKDAARQCASSARRCAWCVRTRLGATTSEKVAWTAGLPEPELQISVRNERTSECYCGGAGLESGPYAFTRGGALDGGVTPTSLAALFLLVVWGTEVCSATENPRPAGESLADTILDRVAEDRVRRFRMTYSLQEDQDFAGLSFDGVRAAGERPPVTLYFKPGSSEAHQGHRA